MPQQPWTPRTGPAYNLNHIMGGMKKIERRATHPILGRILQRVIDWCVERDWQDIADRWKGEPEYVSTMPVAKPPTSGTVFWGDIAGGGGEGE